MCDWCCMEHDTIPVVLGYTVTGEICDADICVNALKKMEECIARDGQVGIYRYRVYGTGDHFRIDRTFQCDLIEA